MGKRVRSNCSLTVLTGCVNCLFADTNWCDVQLRFWQDKNILLYNREFHRKKYGCAEHVRSLNCVAVMISHNCSRVLNFTWFLWGPPHKLFHFVITSVLPLNNRQTGTHLDGRIVVTCLPAHIVSGTEARKWLLPLSQRWAITQTLPRSWNSSQPGN